jgi:hypothetical protein
MVNNDRILDELRPLIAQRSRLKAQMDAVDRKIEELAGVGGGESRPKKPRLTNEEARRACGLK